MGRNRCVVGWQRTRDSEETASLETGVCRLYSSEVKFAANHLFTVPRGIEWDVRASVSPVRGQPTSHLFLPI